MKNRVNKKIKQILRDVAQERGLKYKDVEAVYFSSYKTVADNIMKGEAGFPLSYKFMALPFFGKFVIKMGRVRYFHDSPDEEKVYPFTIKEKKRFKEYYENKNKE